MITLFEGSKRTFVNATAEQMTGYSREALLTGGVEVAVHPDDRSVVRERWTSRSRGETRWLEAHSSPIDDTKMVSIAVDVTDRKQAKATVRASDRRFRTIFEESPTGMALVALDQRFSAVNRALCDMLGYEAETLVTCQMPEVTHPDDIAIDADLVEQVLAGRLGSYRIEKRWRKRDKETVHVSLTLSIVLDRNGQPLHGIAMVEDISQQRRMQDRMMQAQRLESVGLLAGGIAHNFNNALTAVSGYSELLLREFDDRSPAAAEIKKILDVVDRSASLTKQLLAFARQQEVHPERFDVNEAIRTAQRLFEPLVGGEVSVEQELDERPCIV